MTVSTTAASAIFLGNGSTTVFSAPISNGVPFNSNTSLASYTVIYTAVNGVQTTLDPSVYSLGFTAAVTGSLWGIGVALTYPLTGSPIASGTSLSLSRQFALQQLISISNQGDFAAQNIEAMGDIEEMQIQQIAARTGQLRGIWISGIQYNFGDVVVDGINGAATGNYYMCAIANFSGVWATDLAAGDWSLAIDVQAINSIAGGTNGQIQYNNAGVLGGLNSTGSGNVVKANSPTLSTPSTDNINVTGVAIPANGLYLPVANSPTISSGSLPVMGFVGFANAVNYIDVLNNVTGQPPVITSKGSDVNVSLDIQTIGTGSINFATNTGSNTQVEITHTPASANFLGMTGGASGVAPQISGIGAANLGISILGTATNNAALAGYVGEYVTSTVVLASAVSLVNNTAKTVTSISLTAGDWDIGGNIGFSNGASTVRTYLVGAISTTNNTLPATSALDWSLVNTPSSIAQSDDGFVVPGKQISISSTTTYYLIADSGFSVSTLAAYGRIWARRVR